MPTWLLLIRLYFSLTKFFVFILWGILLEPVSFSDARRKLLILICHSEEHHSLTFLKSLAAEINQQILDWRQYTPNLG